MRFLPNGKRSREVKLRSATARESEDRIISTRDAFIARMVYWEHRGEPMPMAEQLQYAARQAHNTMHNVAQLGGAAGNVPVYPPEEPVPPLPAHLQQQFAQPPFYAPPPAGQPVLVPANGVPMANAEQPLHYAAPYPHQVTIF